MDHEALGRQADEMIARQALRLHDGWWYLATAYTRFEGAELGDSICMPGMDGAFAFACRVAGKLIDAGVTVYSPIAHCHPIAPYTSIPAEDSATWVALNRVMMRTAYGILVAADGGWERSSGIAAEIEFFQRLGRPCRLLDPVTLTAEVMT